MHRRVDLAYTDKIIVRADVHAFDASLDLALLATTDNPFPDDVELHALVARGPQYEGARFKTQGYPRERPFVDAVPVDGHIVDPYASIFGGVPAIALYSGQAGQGQSLRGLSGAPVIVQRDASRPSSVPGAIGIVRWGEPALDARGLPSGTKGGQYYATPSELAVGRWPELGAAVIGELPPLPSDSAIRKYVRLYTGTPSQPTPFGGRAQELETLMMWAGGGATLPFALVVAPPGQGKSALLVRLADALTALIPSIDVVLIPIAARFGLTAEEDFVLALTARLAAAHGEPLVGATIREWREEAARLLERNLPGDRRLAVLVDGLDEAAGGWGIGDWVPAQVGTRTRLAVAARLTGARPHARAWLDELGWHRDDAFVCQLGALSSEGVKEALASGGPFLAAMTDDDDLVRRLHELCEGDPLVLSLYLDDLQARGKRGEPVTPDCLGLDVPGLDGFMERWWREQERLWGGSWGAMGQHVRRVFDMLALALGPLDLRALRGLIPNCDGDQIRDALQALDRFILETGHATYTLGHPRLATHRRRRLEEDGDLTARLSAFLDWGRETLAELREGVLQPQDAPGYLVLHLGEHFEDVDAPPDLMLELLDPTWRAAWDARGDRHDGHLADVDRARRSAWSVDDTYVRAGDRATCMTEQVSAIAARVQARHRSSMITPSCLRELVRQGRFSSSRALDFARAAASPSERAEALAAIAGMLTDETLTEAVALSRAVDNSWPLLLGRALAALTTRVFALSGVSAALDVLGSRPAGVARGVGRVALAAELRSRQRDELVWDILEVDLAVEEEERTEVIRVLTRSVPAPAAHANAMARVIELAAPENPTYAAMWEWLLPNADDSVGSPGVLTRVAPWLSDDRRQGVAERLLAALDVDLRVPGWTATEIAELAPCLDASLATKALDLAERRCGDDAGFLAQVIVALLDVLPHPEPQRARLRELLPAVVDAPGGDDYEELLADLAAAGFASDCLRLLRQLGIERRQEKEGGVVAIAPYLCESDVREFLERVDPEIMVGRRPAVYSALLARLAAFGGQGADDALRLASMLRDDDELEAAAAPFAAPAAALLLPHAGGPALRCAAVQATSALETMPFPAEWVVNSFQKPAWRTAAFAALLDGVTSEAAATEDMLAAARFVIRTGGDPAFSLEDKAIIVMRYFTCLAEGLGGARTIAEAHRLAGGDHEPVAWALAGAAHALAPSEVAGALEVARNLPEAHAAVALAAIVAAHRSAETMSAWKRVAFVELLPSVVAPVREAALALRCLPDDLRSDMLDAVVPRDAIVNGRGRAWARFVVRLLPALDRPRVDLVRQASSQAEGSSPRGLVLAAVASRLATLRDLDAAFEAADEIPYTEERALALRGMLPAVPDAGFDEWLRRVEAIDGTEVRDERALLAADSCCRLARLGPIEQWKVWSTRLPQAESWTEFAMLLLARAAAFVNLHGPARIMPVLDSPVASFRDGW